MPKLCIASRVFFGLFGYTPTLGEMYLLIFCLNLQNDLIHQAEKLAIFGVFAIFAFKWHPSATKNGRKVTFLVKTAKNRDFWWR